MLGNSLTNFHCCTTALSCGDSAFFGAAEDRKWPGGIGGNCLSRRWPVLIQHHLQTSRSTSLTVACATQWVLLIVSGVYRRRKMRASHPGSQKGWAKGWAMYVPLCTVALTDVYKLPSDGGSGSSHINHSHRGMPHFQSSSAARTTCFCFFSSLYLSLKEKETFCLFRWKYIF